MPDHWIRHHWAVGELRSALEAAGALDDTLVIVTSDNGAPMIFSDDGDVSVHQPNGPWRGQKGDLWDGGHREPLVARWPGAIPSGMVRDDPVCLTDVLPTVAAVTRAAVPDGAAEDGVDVLGVLTGAGRLPPDRPIVHHSLAGHFALRSGRWKAIFSSGSGGGFSEPSITSLFGSGSGKAHAAQPWGAEHPAGQLYDVVVDPHETTNIWDGEPAVVSTLYNELRKICRDETSGLPFDVSVGSPH